MPNWSYNTIDITGPERVVTAWFNNVQSARGSDVGLLGVFVTPEYDADGKNWYMAHINAWDTKWDVPPHDVQVTVEENGHIKLEFTTAWSPPIAWMRTMSVDWPSLTFRMYFEEEGMDFLGFALAQNGQCFFRDDKLPDHESGLWYLEDDEVKRNQMKEQWDLLLEIARAECALIVEQSYFDYYDVSDNERREYWSNEIGNAYDKAE